jgi:hypothetical protein
MNILIYSYANREKTKKCVPIMARHAQAVDAVCFSGGKPAGRLGLLNFHVCLLSAAVNNTDGSSESLPEH